MISARPRKGRVNLLMDQKIISTAVQWGCGLCPSTLPTPTPFHFVLNHRILLWDELDTSPPTIGTKCATSSSCSYSQWYDLLIMTGKGCLNQGCLSGPRLPLQTKGKMLLAQGCGSEDKERKFTWTLRGTRTRKFFLILSLALSLTPSRIFYHSVSLHIFCPLSTNCILSIFIYRLPWYTTVYTTQAPAIPQTN